MGAILDHDFGNSWISHILGIQFVFLNDRLIPILTMLPRSKSYINPISIQCFNRISNDISSDRNLEINDFTNIGILQNKSTSHLLFSFFECDVWIPSAYLGGDNVLYERRVHLFLGTAIHKGTLFSVVNYMLFYIHFYLLFACFLF